MHIHHIVLLILLVKFTKSPIFQIFSHTTFKFTELWETFYIIYFIYRKSNILCYIKNYFQVSEHLNNCFFN